MKNDFLRVNFELFDYWRIKNLYSPGNELQKWIRLEYPYENKEAVVKNKDR